MAYKNNVLNYIQLHESCKIMKWKISSRDTKEEKKVYVE